jgi:hypothetical protein
VVPRPDRGPSVFDPIQRGRHRHRDPTSINEYDAEHSGAVEEAPRRDEDRWRKQGRTASPVSRTAEGRRTTTSRGSGGDNGSTRRSSPSAPVISQHEQDLGSAPTDAQDLLGLESTAREADPILGGERARIDAQPNFLQPISVDCPATTNLPLVFIEYLPLLTSGSQLSSAAQV